MAVKHRDTTPRGAPLCEIKHALLPCVALVVAYLLLSTEKSTDSEELVINPPRGTAAHVLRQATRIPGKTSSTPPAALLLLNSPNTSSECYPCGTGGDLCRTSSQRSCASCYSRVLCHAMDGSPRVESRVSEAACSVRTMPSTAGYVGRIT